MQLSVLRHSSELDKIANALVMAQGNMGAIREASKNPHFNSTYADLADVIDGVQPALQGQGIALIQAPGGDGALITVETMLLHTSGQWIAAALTLKPAKPDPQGAGSAITYGRRYSLLGMCGVATTDDDGNAASKKQNAPGANNPPAEISQADRVKAAMKPIIKRAHKLGLISDISTYEAGRDGLQAYALDKKIDFNGAAMMAHLEQVEAAWAAKPATETPPAPAPAPAAEPQKAATVTKIDTGTLDRYKPFVERAGKIALIEIGQDYAENVERLREVTEASCYKFDRAGLTTFLEKEEADYAAGVHGDTTISGLPIFENDEERIEYIEAAAAHVGIPVVQYNKIVKDVGGKITEATAKVIYLKLLAYAARNVAP